MPDAAMPGPLTAAQEKHWQDCTLCQRRVARAHAVDWFDEDSDEEFAAAVAARLAATAGPVSVRLPQALASRLFGSYTEADAAPGRLWQLQWQTRACLVAVIAVRGWHATVAAVTTDADLAGADSLVLDASASPLAAPTAVWLATAATVPLAAFARELGPLAVPADTLLGALRSVRSSGAVGPDAPHGIQGREHQVDTLELVDALQAELAWFASADHTLSHLVNGSAQALDATDRASRIRAVPRDELEAVGLSRAALLPALRGAALTDAQAAALAPLLGVEADALTGQGAAPEGLLVEASSPRWFRPRAAFIAAHGYTDAEGVVELTNRAQFALAARTTGRHAEPDWRARVAFVLHDYGLAEQ